MAKEYKVVNGTSYDVRTPDEVIRVLENARKNHTRIHISLGDTEKSLVRIRNGGTESRLGLDWLNENDTYGYVGRSSGSVKIPLLIHNSRSVGGNAILDHCIVRIRRSTGAILYWHPNYHFGKMETKILDKPFTYNSKVKGKLIQKTLTVGVYQDGSQIAAFEDMEKTRKYLHKLGVVAPITPIMPKVIHD